MKLTSLSICAFPKMGEASSSRLRIWDHALPSLAMPVGWYADLPPEAIGFVEVKNEVADLHQLFDALLTHPESHRRLGEQGREELASRHDPGSYVDAVMRLVDPVQSQHA